MINKMKKITISIMISIIIILGIQSIVNAYYIGQNLDVTYDEYISNGNIYCMEHGQALYGYNNYRIISHVKIEGNKSIDDNGKEMYSSDNAKFAAILSADNGAIKDDGPVANAIWNFGYTWMKNVGQYHAGLYDGFASATKGNVTDLDNTSTNYANSIQNMEMTDKTNKDNVKATTLEREGIQYIRVGPFNWSFAGALSEIKLYDQDNKQVSGLTYSKFNGNDEVILNISEISSESDFYISVPIDSGINKITKISAKTNVDVKGVDVWFLESTNGASFQNLLIREPYNASQDLNMDFEYNILLQGNLKVIKVNKNNEEVKLSGVGFYIQNKNTQKYIKQNADGTVSYITEKGQATEFVTDQNGEILIKNLLVGTYVAYETKNPNYGYEIITEGQEKTIVVDKTAELKIPNEQKYVKLSGYVWVDKADGKQSKRNDLYKDSEGYQDTKDILLDGITVKLKDKSGNVIKEAKTSNGGAYIFTDVLIKDLSNYYIEFEYDGLTYTNVIPHIDKDNGSKSAENATTREQFNQNFAIVEGKTESTGITKDVSKNQKYSLSYNVDKLKHTSTLINNGQYIISSNTNETGYNIIDHFTPGQEEIKYINLGLYEREQPDLALVNDIQNVRLTINGYEHTYNYDQRGQHKEEYGDGFNIGVKFEEKYLNMTYTRPIYKSDYEFENPTDKSKELKVYITHKITLGNKSTNLISQVNSFVDYFDSRYSVVAVGDGIDEKGKVTGKFQYAQSEYNSEYSKIVVDSNTRLEPQKTKEIYVQFELSREAVLNILNNGENLKNVAEITSYSVFDTDGKIYAGIDKNSNPGNAIPNDITTYEDDTASSPNLKLEVTDAREVSGKVFLDTTSGELKTGDIRQGSGKYEDGEKGIKGVKLTLTENTGSGKIYTAETNENGDFVINGFIPGDYTLTYTWGDNTYTVQNYKGTVYDSSRDQTNKYWYKENVDTRLTDAIDDYQLRQKIDDEMKTITSNTKYTINQMNSDTPTMGIGIEYETTYTASMGDKYTYRISNVDFGIVERARQNIELDKRVKTMKLTLANGQVIADVTIDENGNLSGEKSHIIYMRPSDKTQPKNGLLKVELDNELLEDALLQVGYEFKAINKSEIDYLSENYYKYGKKEGNKVTITPLAVVDYLDTGWAFDDKANKEWTVKTSEDLKEIVSENIFNNGNSSVKDKTILYTESLKTKLQPTQSVAVVLNVAKKLSNSGADISLDNETEIVKVEKDGGAKIDSTPGNYVPGTGHTETDDDMAETIIVTPNTGANLNFILPIAIGVIALITLGVGIVVIKKKALK